MHDEPDPERQSRRPFVLRVRGRATVVVVVLGLPMAVAYGGLRVLPDALWFDEVGQPSVFRGILLARLEVYVLVAAVAACFIAANLALAVRPSATMSRRARLVAVSGVAILTGSLFGSSVQGHWQTYLLWRHRQSFGVTDPVHGRDVGFFVFTLPLALVVSAVLLWLVVVAGGYVAVAYKLQGRLGITRPDKAFPPLLHLGVLSAMFLLVAAWRFQLEQYRLELGQPPSPDTGAVAGAGYVDIQVRLPGVHGARHRFGGARGRLPGGTVRRSIRARAESTAARRPHGWCGGHGCCRRSRPFRHWSNGSSSIPVQCCARRRTSPARSRRPGTAWLSTPSWSSRTRRRAPSTQPTSAP